MSWHWVYLAFGFVFFFSSISTSPVYKTKASLKKSLLKNATGLRWLRRDFEEFSTPSPPIAKSSIDRLTLVAFCVSLLRMLIPSLNENTKELVPPSTPSQIDQSQDMNTVDEINATASKQLQITSFSVEHCSQRAACDMERKWRHLTSNIRAIVERSFRNSSSPLLDFNNSVWEPPFKPHKDVCALLYPECSFVKYSDYLIKSYLIGAAKLSENKNIYF